jgi:chaperonin GroES
MKIKPLNDRIVVERLEAKGKTAGGIFLPDNAKEKPKQGRVVAVGEGRLTKDGKRIAPDVKTGDTVVFGAYAGTEVELDGKEYAILKEEDILGVVESTGKARSAGA